MTTDRPAGERIAKVIARAGYCSRREAERLIEQGKVKVDGAVLESAAFFVTDVQEIHIDNKLLKKEITPRLWMFHKTKASMTTHNDPQGRQTVFDQLPEDMPHVISIGRLDYNTEGLLLLTNHGPLARYMEHPSSGLKRRYRVRAFGKIDPRKLAEVRSGVAIDGIHYRPALIEKEPGSKENAWYDVVVKEGKNREIRKIFEFMGAKVSRLIRTEYGEFRLGRMPLGGITEISKRQIEPLLKKASA